VYWFGYFHYCIFGLLLAGAFISFSIRSGVPLSQQNERSDQHGQLKSREILPSWNTGITSPLIKAILANSRVEKHTYEI